MKAYKIIIKTAASLKSRIMFFTISFILTACTTNSKALPGTMTDIDGNVYHTVTIGSQVWMAENLKTTHYNNGSDIPNVKANAQWSELTTGALCWYENDPSTYKDTYGALYNFYAVNDGRKLCPSGWHVPTKDEWLILENYLGGNDIAGGKMKEIGTKHWNNPNTGVTNESGFTGIPGGGRGRKGEMGEIGNYATWWSSTSEDINYAWHWGLHPDKASTRRNPGHKASGFSVRCIKN